ncbi:hypothetical protein, variant [Cladophialophora immunda]|uniref:Uncharacterized protein n=1 Tax=Cladophialophora immunda TaxID=569365 RepID=A0A0D2C091_9EURO|nr:uncharacterized protein PV07_09692 [Cladophialophora immunda]XP_016244162.1 hypothetical protein, variant [Cladophialophora immunda]KIW23945.1 hypothetical protein PV07_09692 [Cladophialophora immunda]KIW23946.1 hypothetical protein, variant [Cladophialophora immunda]OQV08306.1 hypothetical protein CLAIMM_12606 isoform 1 [Cladophialophora immunda]OQV08307.1 hypothetical protein CLAIMM_12606 isoform 2 [Cladophialophora immunda]OQV08308.1 hypothetical protein CLAIMM_12606 isoform 3 [Cladophi
MSLLHCPLLPHPVTASILRVFASESGCFARDFPILNRSSTYRMFSRELNMRFLFPHATASFDGALASTEQVTRSAVPTPAVIGTKLKYKEVAKRNSDLWRTKAGWV